MVIPAVPEYPYTKSCPSCFIWWEGRWVLWWQPWVFGPAIFDNPSTKPTVYLASATPCAFCGGLAQYVQAIRWAERVLDQEIEWLRTNGGGRIKWYPQFDPDDRGHF